MSNISGIPQNRIPAAPVISKAAPAIKEVKTEKVKAEKEEPILHDQLGATVEKDSGKAKELYKAKFRGGMASKNDGIGYDDEFIGAGFKVPLPQITGPAKDKVLVYNNRGDTVRDYTHFSLEMNKERKLAFYTAHNVDGSNLQTGIKRGKWKIDEEIGYDNQMSNYIYSNNPIDRGHLVRRIAVAWGSKSEAKRASDDTFNYTNASPQHERLNKKIWLDLENWLLEKADVSDKKLAVFTGPVFRENDKVYRDEKIPADFWKIIVVKKNDGKLGAAGFMMSQKQWIDGLYKSVKSGNQGKVIDIDEVPTSAVSPFQVSLKTIEELTNLDFGELREVDAYSLYKNRKQDLYKGKGPILQEDTTLPAHNEITKAEDIII